MLQYKSTNSTYICIPELFNIYVIIFENALSYLDTVTLLRTWNWKTFLRTLGNTDAQKAEYLINER